MSLTKALVSPEITSIKMEEITITPNKKNKALSSLKERRRRQTDTCKQEAHDTKASHGVSDEDGIDQIRNMLSEDCSDMKTSSATENVNGDSRVRKDAIPTNDDKEIVNGGNSINLKTRSLCTVSTPPQANDTDEHHKTTNQSSSVQRYNRARLRISRLREEKNEGEERIYDLKPAISDLSNKTETLYPHGETTSKSPDVSNKKPSKNDEHTKKGASPAENLSKKNQIRVKKMENAKMEHEEADEKEKSAVDAQRQRSKNGSQQIPKVSNIEQRKDIEKIERDFELAREEHRKTNDNLRFQLGQLKKRLEQRDTFIEQVKTSSSELESKTKDLLKENNVLHEQIDQMSNELQKCRNVLDHTFEENQDLINRMQTLEINFQRKEEKLKKSVEKQLASIQKDVVKAVNDLKQENLQKDNTINLLERSVEDRKRKIDVVNEQLVEYKEKVVNLTEMCEQMGKKLEKYQLKNEMLEDKIEDSKKKNQTLKEAQEKRRASFEKELHLQQQKYDKIVKETKESYIMREEQIRKALQVKLSNEHTKLQEFQREEEKKYSAREEELKIVLESQIEKLQAFYEKELNKAEEESKRYLEEAREDWHKQLEDKLKERDAFNLEIQDKLQHETEKLREELITKDALMKKMQEEIDSKAIAEEENEKNKALLASEFKKLQQDNHLKNDLIQQLQEEIKMKTIAIEKYGEKTNSLSKHIEALTEEKDHIIPSLKEELENERASHEALSKLTGAAIKTLKEELDEKQILLEHLNSKEIELSLENEKKDRLIQCLAERLEINQLAVESLTLSLQARDHETTWTTSQLEGHVSDKSKGEITSRLHHAEKELGSFRENTCEDDKDFKIAKYESELRHFKTWIETRNSAESQSGLDMVVEKKHSLDDKSEKLEQNVTKLQQTIKSILMRKDANNLDAKKPLSPVSSPENLQKYDSVNFMHNEMHAQVPKENISLSTEENHNQPVCEKFDSLETSATPKEICRTKTKVLIGISTAVSSNSMATTISKSFSDSSERNETSLLDSLLQSTDSEVTETSENVDSQQGGHVLKNEFMSGETPKARPSFKIEAFPTTPKEGKETKTEFPGEENPSVVALPEEVQSSHEEPDNSTAYRTANGCDQSMPSSHQTRDVWGSSKSSLIPNRDPGGEAHNSPGINPIHSSESSVSDCTFESHTYSIAAGNQLISIPNTDQHVKDLLETATTPTSGASFDSVEDKIRSTIAQWEYIQASCLVEKSGDRVVKESDGDSAFYSFSVAGSSL